jgi:polar amino acid transport system substrate-binding protein
MYGFAIGLASLMIVASCATAQPILPAARDELAPTGKLRVGIHYVNIFIVNKDPASGEPRGVAIDLARELGRRIGRPVEFVGYANANRLTRAVESGEWDISFQAAEASRGAAITFTPGYVEIDATYLVPAGSLLRTTADVDREGVRVAVAGKSGYDLILTRLLKNAQLVRAQGFGGSVQVFVSDKLEALAGLRPQLVLETDNIPGSRVLDDRFAVLPQAIGSPKGRDLAANYLREFVEDVKRSGLVAKAIERAGVRGLSVAPTAPTQ